MGVLVCVAHPDDEAIGVGGTIAKYAKKGRNVVTIIFSLGEGSNPLLDPEYLTKRRRNESIKVGKMLGVKEVIFMGLGDVGFVKDIADKEVKRKLRVYFERFKPKTIFTHCIDDPHPHHRAVASLIKDVVDELGVDANIYTFTVTNPLRFIHRERPRLYINISDTFEKKMKALDVFKSQKEYMFYIDPLIRFSAWYHGFRSGNRYAEVFHLW